MGIRGFKELVKSPLVPQFTKFPPLTTKYREVLLWDHN